MDDMIRKLALQLIQKNPRIANNPRNKEFIEAIQNGDDEKGKELAMNICNTYGKTKQDAMNDIFNKLGHR